VKEHISSFSLYENQTNDVREGKMQKAEDY